MFLTTAFAPDRADLEDLILDAPEKVLFCRIGPDAENISDSGDILASTDESAAPVG